MEQIQFLVEEWRWLFTIGGFLLGIPVRLYVVRGERQRRRRERERNKVDPIAAGARASIQRRMETRF